MPAKTTHQLEDVNNPYGYSDMDWPRSSTRPTPPPVPKSGASVWARTARCPSK